MKTPAATAKYKAAARAEAAVAAFFAAVEGRARIQGEIAPLAAVRVGVFIATDIEQR